MGQTGEIKEISKEADIEWTIPNSGLSKKTDQCCYSPYFSFANQSWVLYMYPNGRSSSNSVGFIDLCLENQSKIPSEKIKVALGLKNFNKKKNNKIVNAKFVPGVTYAAVRYLTQSEFWERKEEFLSSDSLTVLCTLKKLDSAVDPNDTDTAKCPHCKKSFDINDISCHKEKCLDKPVRCSTCADVVALRKWYDHKCEMPKAKAKSCSVSPQENKVLRDLKRLFLEKEDCDVILKVQGQEFPAHKNILKVRSSVFASTFRIDMKEKKTGVVEIEDCDSFSFSDFLCFVYCGDEEVISQENVFSLFTAADKYDIRDLRSKCLEIVKEKLSVDTFCDAITLAYRHSEIELIQLTTDFFIAHAPKIILTVKWQSFLAENPTESNELLVKHFACNSSSSNKFSVFQ